MNTPQYKYKYREQKLDREDCIKMKHKNIIMSEQLYNLIETEATSQPT
jgi:hypothetical protein